jgi:hypothetical protein
MYGARDQLFARSRLTAYDRRRVGGRYSGDVRHDAPQFGVFPDNFNLAGALYYGFLQIVKLRL